MDSDMSMMSWKDSKTLIIELCQGTMPRPRTQKKHFSHNTVDISRIMVLE